ncbi:aminoglycoside 6-adenylyltransferase [Acinetobacter rudis]|uniref:Aminoglycoside 6-adenylyltransferase n=1 Tax=Acinetobacter rudis TaxID=632955 RepID=A0AAW8JAY9_9GAMM|nr:aminoglycoside 6-adenylyltransferase [Acinetobacter rudis]MDQ8935841.1 aminoglycoside 6-adenylyltransferase [Acinetobacter rudis]MDQ9018121.1 aminoglycoside 6-adenylyltransferase [Acinetobacter rudis]
MKSNRDIEQIIKHTVNTDPMMRAAILNGSRANKNIIPDQYQDFDVAIFVTDLEAVKASKFWIALFGQPILAQYPDDMLLGEEEHPTIDVYTCLMIFADHIRIDLKIYPVDQFYQRYQSDSLTVVWVDKDGLFTEIAEANDHDYFIGIPDQRSFSEHSNEFWWCSTNVMKGLARREIIYAKDMLENVLRPTFMTMLQWSVGCHFGFERSLGKSGKFLPQYLSVEQMQQVLSTYSASGIQENWAALFVMLDLFEQYQITVAQTLHFKLNVTEIQHAKRYIAQNYAEFKQES